MHILILGGGGFLGRNCAVSLAKKHNVTILDRFAVSIPGCKNETGELHDVAAITDIISREKIDVVMHFVSSLLPSSDLQAYIREIQTIYSPSLLLMEYCAKHKVKICYISSGGAVYGEQNESMDEGKPANPISLYGLSKQTYEDALAFFERTRQLQFMILRPSNPYGYGQNLYGKQGLIAAIIGKTLKNEEISIWGDGSAEKDYIYIDDFVYYVESLIESDGSWNHIYNIGCGRSYSVNQVLQIFSENSIQLPEVRYISNELGDVTHMHLDCSKLKRMIPHDCKSLREGIALFWAKATHES